QEYVPAIGDPTIEVQVDETCTVTVNWITTFLISDPQNASHVSWPQQFAGFGSDYVPACGVQIQQDIYTGSRAVIDAVLEDDMLDGNPIEDSHIIQSWKFLDGGECAPEVPQPEVVIGEWSEGSVSCDVP